MRLTPTSRHLRRSGASLLAAAVLGLGILNPAATAPAQASPDRGAGVVRAGVPAPVVSRSACARQGRKFRPTTLGIEGVITPRRVLALGRDADGVPQAPPLTDAGKQQFAWDAEDHIKAGAKHGVIKMNAHTYPDGSALGNTLIEQLDVGNRMVVRGAKGQLRCYDVVDRVQITAETRYRRYYRTTGPGRLAIAVCSGVRRGPGDWSHRTIWFAKQVG